MLVNGCTPKKAPVATKAAVQESMETVVATVNGVPIEAERVASHARALGMGAREALGDLIAFELLAAEASRRGYNKDPEVAETRAREMVRRFLQVAFEPTAQPENIPEADIRREYERNKRFFNRPELRTVVTVLFPAKRGVASKEQVLQAQNAAKELADRWRAEQPKDAEAAKAVVDTYFGHLGGIRVDRFNTYEGAEAEPTWLKAALKLRTPHEVSDPVRTRYGWHVIWLEEIHPAKNTPEEEALRTIRREFHPVWQRTEFLRFVDKIQASSKVETYPERLAGGSGVAQPGP